MARHLLIATTHGFAGETTISCALAFAARARKMRVGVLKPVETGCADVKGDLDPLSARALASAASATTVGLDIICPFRYRKPLAPAAAAHAEMLPPPDIDVIVRSFERIAKGADLAIVEAMGGVAAPIIWGFDYADLCLMLGLHLVIVAANAEGCVDATALALAYAKGRRARIAGVVLMDLEASLSPAALTNEASLRRLGGPFLGHVRLREPVGKPIIDALLSPAPST